jgi:hypothetical protein
VLVLVLVVVLVLDFEGELGLRCRNNPELESKALQTYWMKGLFEDEDEDDRLTDSLITDYFAPTPKNAVATHRLPHTARPFLLG